MTFVWRKCNDSVKCGAGTRASPIAIRGITAAGGLVLFFVAAIITHVRAHDYPFGLAVAFLMLAVALVLRVIFWGASNTDESGVDDEVG